MAVQGLAGVSRRYLRQRPGRTLLTGIGIALGVAAFLANLIVTESFSRGLGKQRQDFGVDVWATPAASGDGRTSLPEDAFDSLASIDGVEAVLPDLSWSVHISPANDPDHSYSSSDQVLYGVDPVQLDHFAAAKGVDADFYAAQPSSGRRFHDGADEVMMSEASADFLGVDVGGELITRDLPGDQHRLEITGLLSDNSLGGGPDSRMFLTSLKTARRLSGQSDGLSAVAINLDEDVSVERFVKSPHDLDQRIELELPGSWVDTSRDELRQTTGTFAIYTALVVFGAGYLIFVTLSLAVAERQPTLGILRALGASRRQLFAHVVAEGLVVGVVATFAAVPLGVVFAAGWIATQPDQPGASSADGVPLTLAALVMAAALGLGTTLVATAVPAWRAAQMSPIDAIREASSVGRTPRRRSFLAGAAALVGGLLVASRGSSNQAQTIAGLLFVLSGAVLLVPAVTSMLFRWRSGGTTGVVMAHLTRERTRAAHTVALVMLVIATTIAIGAAVTSATRTGRAQIDAMFSNVIHVSQGDLNEARIADISEVPGVAAVSPVWWSGTDVSVGAAQLDKVVFAIDPDTYFDVRRLPLVAGDEQEVAKRLRSGGSAVVPKSLADKLDVGVDEPITLRTLEGPRQMSIAGLYQTASGSRDGWSAVIVSREDWRRQIGDNQPTYLSVGLEEGADPEVVATAIEDLQVEDRFVVATTDEITEPFNNAVAQARSLAVALIAPAGLISALGLANTLAVIILERRREVGILRSLGFDRRQARRLAYIETGLLVSVAVLLAIPLGLGLSVPLVDATAAGLGAVYDYAVPWAWLGIAIVIAGGLAVVGSLAPARRAARIEVGAALRYE